MESDVRVSEKVLFKRGGSSIEMEYGFSPKEFLNVTRHKFKKMVEEAKPLMCWFSLTEGCDLRCKYCFSNSSQPLRHELSTREVLKAIDNMAAAGTQAIVFGGGEPTLREDLLQIANYAVKQHSMYVALNTHGQKLADRHYVRALAGAGFSQIKISLDGLQKSHDWNRGEGTFQQCIQALKNCVDEEFPSVWLIATISKLNYKEIPELLNLGMELGVEVGMVQLLPLGRGKDIMDLMLTTKQTMNWQRYLFEQKKVHGGNKVLFEDRYQICEDELALKVAINPKQTGTFLDTPAGCITGIWQYAVGADGKVYAGDVMAPELVICDLNEQDLHAAWQKSELIQLLKDRDKLKGKCGTCELRFICGGCRRMAFSLSGDILAEDPQCWYKSRLENE
jgi:radical SAM protein with 4Fe4S-binding SPASM domain